MHMRGSATGLGNQGAYFLHEGMDIAAMTFIKCANRAFHFYFIGNDVAAIAALKAADRHYRGLLGDIHFARHNRLQAQHNLRTDHDRINPRPGLRAMGLVAAHKNTELVRARHQRARAIADYIGMLFGGDMQTENRFDFRVVHAALLDHHFCAAFFTYWRHFFGGLKNKFDGAGQIFAHACQNFRNAHQNRHMGIVTAGVHHPGLSAIPLRPRFTFKRHIGFFDHGQAVHIRT